MGLTTVAGQFAEKTTTGNQPYTGFGTPTLLFHLGGTPRTSSGSSIDARQYFGAGMAGPTQVNAGWYSDDGSTTSITSRWQTTTSIRRYQTDATIDHEAALVSLDADGWTDDTTTASGAARLHGAWALGGSDITNIAVGSFSSPGATGDADVTTVGFEPDWVLMFGVRGSGSQANFFIGAICNTGQWASAISDVDNQGTSNAARFQLTNRCVLMFTAGGITLADSASFVSMLSNGFRLNWDIAGTAVTIRYVAVKGGSVSVFSFNQATTTGVATAVSGLPFTPTGVLLVSDCNVSAAGIQSDARMAIGFGSSSTARFSQWAGSSDGAPNAVADSAIGPSNILRMFTEGTPTENARADLDAFGSGTISLDWEVADGTARQILGLAVGDAAAAGGQPTIRRLGSAQHMASLRPIGLQQGSVIFHAPVAKAA